MPDQHEVPPPQPWLVRTSGEFAGTRHVLRETITRVGRGSDNDIVIDEPIVSSYHFEIQNERGAYKICDLKSTNGTFVNGSRIGEANLTPSASIQVGVAGPEFLFVIEEAPAAARSKMKIDGQATLMSEAPDVLSSLRRNTGTATARAHDELLSTAIARARIARERGFGNQTASIMRQMLSDALRRTHRNLKALITILVFLLLASTGYGLWKIQSLRAEKLNIDTQIANLEALLKKSELTAEQADQLADRLEKYEREGRTLQTSLLYRVSVRQPDDLIEGDIATLMAEFGAETYTVPREFVEQVKRFIQQYQGPDRPHMTAALGRSQKDVATMRRILEQAHLPADLVFVALVESAISNANTSSAGAAGIWQFTPATARAYGLSVSKKVDERLDIRKSTEAASKLLRDLILDFGSGSSVMLALAAYNAGTAKVKQGIRRVNDPIKQRNFWYLYRIRALPLETREYVPKVIAAMIVARDPLKFGF